MQQEKASLPLWESFLSRFLKSHCFLTQNSAPQETPLLRTVKPTAWLAKCSCSEGKFHSDSERRGNCFYLVHALFKNAKTMSQTEEVKGFQRIAREDSVRRKGWPMPAFCRVLEAFERNLGRTFTKFSSICMPRSVQIKSAFEFCISFGSTCFLTATCKSYFEAGILHAEKKMKREIQTNAYAQQKVPLNIKEGGLRARDWPWDFGLDLFRNKSKILPLVSDCLFHFFLL